MPTPSETIRAAITAVAKVKAQEDLSLRELLDAEIQLQAFAKALERATDALEQIRKREGPFSRDPLTHAGYVIEAAGVESDSALADIASLLSAAQENK